MDDVLRQAIGWIIAVLVGLFGLAILWLIARREINLQKLISEANGDASLSRFQFLIFTFVIALSFFYVVVKSDDATLPSIPGEIIGLLGISGGSYVISKGIQATKETSGATSTEDEDEAAPPGA